MLPGRPYLLRLGTATTTATVSGLKHRLDIASGSQRPAKQLEPNDIGFANLSLDRALPFDTYDDNRETGGFILIDRLSNATVGAGMIRFPLRRAANLAWQDFTVGKTTRAAIKGHRPAVLWFTGLSGSGKSTIADGVEKRLTALGHHTYLLDGDNVRHGLNRDLGFTDADRVENIRRVIETARLMADAGLIVLVSFISPFRAERRLARERLADDAFLEIFVDTPIGECERRDPKGLYHKARVGETPEFHGHRLGLRAARGARPPSAHPRDDDRRRGRSHHRSAAAARRVRLNHSQAPRGRKPAVTAAKLPYRSTTTHPEIVERLMVAGACQEACPVPHAGSMSARQFSLSPHRSVIAIGGPDRVDFLQGLISNDTTKVAPGRAIWAALLTPQGRFLNDMFVADGGDDTLLLETERERAAALAKKLSLYKLRSKVTVEDRGETLEVAVAYGPDAATTLPIDGAIAFVDPRLGELGIRVIAPAGTAATLLAGARLLGGAACSPTTSCVVGLGVPDGSRDLVVDKALLLENGFDELNGVDWQKGCYMGQELTARTKYRALIRKRLFPVKVEGALPEPGAPVHLGDQEVGELRSGVGDRALAMLKIDAALSGQALSAGDTRLVAEIPGWMRLPETTDP